MTRVTNFGIKKRTYVQAGFSDTAVVEAPVAPPDSEAPPPKKKRKRTKMSQRDGNKAKNTESADVAEPAALAQSTAAPAPAAKKPNSKKSPTLFFALSRDE
jgi:hypothetical protein